MQPINALPEILRRAAKTSLDYFGSTRAALKNGDHTQVVTEADIRVGEVIFGEVRARFPDDGIVDEEYGYIAGASGRTWIIDPIDGTSNFAAGVPLFGCSIGVITDGVASDGGVVLPAFGDIYLASRGHGAYRNQLKIGVDADRPLTDSLVAFGTDAIPEKPEITESAMRVATRIILASRNMRASNSVYDLMLVAGGNYGACVNTNTMLWDNVACQVIIEEAGGKFTAMDGTILSYDSPIESLACQHYTVLCGSPGIHQQLLPITTEFTP